MHLTDTVAFERSLVVSHAPAPVQPALKALLALDQQLGRILQTTREPIITQMRLAWWREALVALNHALPPAEPVLAALADAVLPRGVDGAALAAMVDGWEALLADTLDDRVIGVFAEGRGGGLFRAGAAMLGADGSLAAAAGEGWALADLAGHVRDPAVADAAQMLARQRLNAAFAVRWPPAARPLGMLALLAKADLDGVAPGSPRRALRLVRHRLTGR